MTDLTRAQLEALVSEATPGPWDIFRDADGTINGIGPLSVYVSGPGPDEDDDTPEVWAPLDVSEPDARLCAAAPALARQLLATMDRAERLEVALAKCLGTFERYAALHAAKPDPVKAAANERMADMIRDALNNQEPAHD